MTEPLETDAQGRIRAAMKNTPLFPLPKGEIWLGTDLLKQAGFADSIENHFHMADRLGQDMVCLPITDGMGEKPHLGYRYFECGDLKNAVRIKDLFVVAVVDGPFQELVNGMGLMEVLMGWARDRTGVIEAYGREQKRSLDLISRCLDTGVHGIIITDDLAADQGPMISPGDIETLCSDFYTQAVKKVHGKGLPVLLHSCGKIRQLTGLISAWQIDGLAAVQHSANNLVELKEILGPGCAIMAGIDAELLVQEPSGAAISEFKRLIAAMAPKGGVILCSSCGLYSRTFLDRIKQIYALADHLQ